MNPNILLNFQNTHPLNPTQHLQLQQPNLYTTKNQYTQNCRSIIKSKSKNFRKTLKKKIASDLIKDNILKNRQSQRITNLRLITSQNIKLFLRLRQQKSSYKINSIQKQSSHTILPLSRANTIRHIQKQRQHYSQKDTSRRGVRCLSAASSLKQQCHSLKRVLRSKQLPSYGSRQIIIQPQLNNKQQIEYETSNRQLYQQDKQNILINKINKLSKNEQDKIIMKKLNIKLIDKQKLNNKYTILINNNKIKSINNISNHQIPIKRILKQINIQNN